MSEYISHDDRDDRINLPYGNTPLSETQALEVIRNINDTKLDKTAFTLLVDATRHVARYIDSHRAITPQQDDTENAPFYYGSVIGYDLGSLIVAGDGPIVTARAQQLYNQKVSNYNHVLSTLPLRYQRTLDTRQSSGDIAPTVGESIYDIGRQAFANLLQDSNDTQIISKALNFRGNELALFNYGAGYSLNAAYQTEDINGEVKFFTAHSEITKFEDDNTSDEFKSFIEAHYS